MWILFAILSAVFASLVAIFAKVGLQGIDSTLATGIRAVVMASFFLIAITFLNKWKELPSIEGKPLMYIIFAGIAGALSWLFYFMALKSGPTTAVAALDRSSIVFVLIFSALILGEAFTWKTILGAIFVLVGTFFFLI